MIVAVCIFNEIVRFERSPAAGNEVRLGFAEYVLYGKLMRFVKCC